MSTRFRRGSLPVLLMSSMVLAALPSHSWGDTVGDRSWVRRGATCSSPSLAPITATSVDRVRLGMTAEQVLSAYGTRARRATVTREGTPEPVIHISDPSGRPLLTADLDNGRVTRIHVRSPRLRTTRGACVGTRLRTLERLYGRGQVLVGEGNVCVVFPRKAPGLSFCLADAYRFVSGGQPPAWSRLRSANPRVETILVVGT
jgi:hypothetical protein